MKNTNDINKLIRKYRTRCDEAMANPRHRSPSVYQLPSWKNVAHLLDELEEELREIEADKPAWLSLNKALILVALQGEEVRKVMR